jgi:hypothetical protein
VHNLCVSRSGPSRNEPVTMIRPSSSPSVPATPASPSHPSRAVEGGHLNTQGRREGSGRDVLIITAFALFDVGNAKLNLHCCAELRQRARIEAAAFALALSMVALLTLSLAVQQSSDNVSKSD